MNKIIVITTQITPMAAITTIIHPSTSPAHSTSPPPIDTYALTPNTFTCKYTKKCSAADSY